ncbi:hypothetical protein FA13DRAFT_318812 [Coprinellus micaceus]|uniref:Uncharacterized protein n=1 Tax=Coprinellus micaceus TaxID=71717 RepID=A0A4Y7TEP3_COPMI|nr:hypothetical protein FA13DRAFT_473887 [Coprinellus micaceus]TEB31999.1 hypothetical protein FA13DRAFT_318812 [Coprinellus micaceus]
MAKLRELMKKLEEEVVGEDGEKRMVQPTIMQEPFRSFFRTAVSVYLPNVLGAKGDVLGLDRKVGCGCVDCAELDEWIRGPEVRCQFESSLGRDRLNHTEERLAEADTQDSIDMYDGVETIRPRSLILEKNTEVVKKYTWVGRQAEAVRFMRHAVLGGEEEMRELLGKGAYERAVKAVHGVRPFELGDLGEGKQNEGCESEPRDVTTAAGGDSEGRQDEDMSVVVGMPADESIIALANNQEASEEHVVKRKREI